VTEIAAFGRQEAERRAQGRRRNLAALKDRIRGSGVPVRDYPDPKALGELVLADLAAVIDSLYPEGSAPDPLARATAEHEAFAAGRAEVFVGRVTCAKRWTGTRPATARLSSSSVSPASASRRCSPAGREPGAPRTPPIS